VSDFAHFRRTTRTDVGIVHNRDRAVGSDQLFFDKKGCWERFVGWHSSVSDLPIRKQSLEDCVANNDCERT
jgi:hypothetical protein